MGIKLGGDFARLYGDRDGYIYTIVSMILQCPRHGTHATGTRVIVLAVVFVLSNDNEGDPETDHPSFSSKGCNP